MKYEVREVSDQVQQNHLAWSVLHSVHASKASAEKEAQRLWEEACKAADEIGSSYVGKSFFVVEVR